MKSTLFFRLQRNELRNRVFTNPLLSLNYLKATFLFKMKNEQLEDTLYVKFYFYAIMVSSEPLIFAHRNRY